jgi:hypothetical protein
VAKIKLTRSKEALVDDDDLPKLSMHKWWCNIYNKVPYAGTNINQRTVLMHRFIMSATGDEMIDHANGDSLDNRKSNLRLCNYSSNGANSKIKQITRLVLKEFI